MRRLTPAAIVLIACSTVLGSSAGYVFPQPGHQERFLGFYVGEERRYVLEPDASFDDGDSAIWIIALETVAADGSSGTFRLHHERRMELGTLVTNPEQRVVSEVVSQAELTVDALGSPQEVLIVNRENLPGLGSDEYSVRYRRDAGKFTKEVSTEEGRWSFEVPVLTDDAFDEVPREGTSPAQRVVAFSPAGLTCLASGYAVTQVERVLMRNSRGSSGERDRGGGAPGGRDRPGDGGAGRDRPGDGPSGGKGSAGGAGGAVATRPGTGGTIIPPTGSRSRPGGPPRDINDVTSTPTATAGGTRNTTPVGTTTNTSAAAFDPATCEVEPLFANPGLLSLIMPAVWDAALGALDLRLLTPLAPALFPNDADGGFPLSIGRNGTVSLSGNPLEWFGGDDEGIDPKSPATNFADHGLVLGDRSRIDVNGRRLDAWNIELSGGLGALQVDDDGKVLRADPDPDAIDGMVGRWIRILFPSEY